MEGPEDNKVPILQLEQIEKSFNGITVLKGINISVKPGEVIGIAGENGAGKSTLVNILGGIFRPSRGRMTWRGQPYSPETPLEASRAGLSVIHQELNLFPNLSIAENLFLPALPTVGSGKAGIVNTGQMIKDARQALETIGLDRNPARLVETLSAGECQLVEIARAVCRSSRLILLDEPTTSLAIHEKKRLFALMTRLREEGISMVFITHVLEDLMEYCDRIIVLRDGEMVGEGIPGELDQNKLISMMIGRSLERAFPQRSVSPGDKCLMELRQFRSRHMREPVDIKLHQGEILGVAGLMGSGRSRMLRGMFGLDKHGSGSLSLDGMDISRLSPRRRIQLGMAFVTESRREDGLCMPGSIEANMLLASLEQFSLRWIRWILTGKTKGAVEKLRGEVHLDDNARMDMPVRLLSGGNQQKSVFAKWLVRNPRVFLLDEPTRGVDVGAKFELYTLIDYLTRNGSGVIVVSSEVEELLGLCDRIMVLKSGQHIKTFSRDSFMQDTIMEAALGG